MHEFDSGRPNFQQQKMPEEFPDKALWVGSGSGVSVRVQSSVLCTSISLFPSHNDAFPSTAVRFCPPETGFIVSAHRLLNITLLTLIATL